MNALRQSKNMFLFFISLVLCLNIVSCNGGGSASSNTASSGSNATLQSIAIAVVGSNTNSASHIKPSKLLNIKATSSNSIYIPVGSSEIIAAYGVYSDQSVKDLTSKVKWISANPSIVSTIAADGQVVTISPGSTKVTASYEGLSGSASLTITSAKLVSINVSPYPGMSESAPVGLSDYYYRAIALYDNGESADVSTSVNWSSGSPNVAKIDAYGYITAMAPGTTEITASYNGKKSSLLFTVTDAKLISIDISATTSNLPLGETEVFTAIGNYTDGTFNITNNVTWISSDNSIASFDSNHQLNPLATGTTNITASLGDITSSPFTVNTISAVLTSVSIEVPSELDDHSIIVGTCELFKAMGKYSNGESLDVSSILSWISSDTSVATVDAGQVCSVNDQSLVGKEFTVTATRETGISDSTTLTVVSDAMTGITLSADQESGVVGVPITFKAIGNNRVDVTNHMNWSVNGTPIESNVYTPNESGVTVTVTATEDSHLPVVPITNNIPVLSTYPKQIELWSNGFNARTFSLLTTPIPLPYTWSETVLLFANYKDASHHTFLPFDSGENNITLTNDKPGMFGAFTYDCPSFFNPPSGVSRKNNCVYWTSNISQAGDTANITITDKDSGVSNTYPVIVDDTKL